MAPLIPKLVRVFFERLQGPSLFEYGPDRVRDMRGMVSAGKGKLVINY